MAESNSSVLIKSQLLNALHAALDPKSLLLSRFSDSSKPHFQQRTAIESFVMVRGPRYKEYSDLRDKRLRKTSLAEPRTPVKERGEKLEDRPAQTPPRKQVKFNSDFTAPPKRPKGSSPSPVLTHSTPDFVSAQQKENRKPVAERLTTPPPAQSKNVRIYENVGGATESASTAEKRSGGLMATKRHARPNELKWFAAAAGGRGGSTISGRIREKGSGEEW